MGSIRIGAHEKERHKQFTLEICFEQPKCHNISHRDRYTERKFDLCGHELILRWCNLVLCNLKTLIRLDSKGKKITHLNNRKR